MQANIQDKLLPIANERGIIAEQYAQLQAVPVLDEAKQRYPLPPASDQSTVRSVFQAVEIALLNIADLTSRATDDIRAGECTRAAEKMFWARGFHYVLVRLSMMPGLLGYVPAHLPAEGELMISSSPAFQAYAAAIKVFDYECLTYVHSGELPLKALIAEQTLSDTRLHLIHLVRLCSHEATIWEQSLSRVPLSVHVPSYDEFVVTQGMHEAVYDTVLEGDTYYTQFRGLHQVPEILCAEMNDHLEAAILELRVASLTQVYEHLRQVNILSDGLLAALLPMVDCLTTADYHNIRENLGLTSGSHSVSIHYHLFRDLYGQICDELAHYVLGNREEAYQEQDVEKAIRQADLQRFESQEAFLLHILADELLKLRMFLHQWRNGHLHFPRNNVGGSYTKSLTGSPDAVQTVKKMRETALLKDALQPLVDARDLRNAPKNAENTPLTTYFETSTSLDSTITNTTGAITKERFKHVQDRSGIFANKSTFVPPPKREV